MRMTFLGCAWCARQKLPLDSTLELSLATHVGLSLGEYLNENGLLVVSRGEIARL